jgi:nitrogen fixation-related uncharacterized protein
MEAVTETVLGLLVFLLIVAVIAAVTGLAALLWAHAKDMWD